MYSIPEMFGVIAFVMKRFVVNKPTDVGSSDDWHQLQVWID